MSPRWNVQKLGCSTAVLSFPITPVAQGTPLLMHSFPLCFFRASPCLLILLPITAILLKLQKWKYLAFHSINVFSVSNYSGVKYNLNLEDPCWKCNTWILTWLCWGTAVDLEHGKLRHEENIKFEFKVTVNCVARPSLKTQTTASPQRLSFYNPVTTTQGGESAHCWCLVIQ